MAGRNRSHFTRSITNFDPAIQATFDQFWSKILIAQIFPIGLPGETTAGLQMKVVPFSGETTIGLAQAIHFFPLPDGDFMVHHEVTNASDLKLFLDRNRAQIEERFNRESLLDLADCFLCTRSFDLWWLEYFSAPVEHIDSEFSNVKIIPQWPLIPIGRRNVIVERLRLLNQGKEVHGTIPKLQGFKDRRFFDHSCHYSSFEETSPVRVDEGDGADDQDLELGQLLSQAKQVFSSGCRVAPGSGHGGGTSVARHGPSVLLSKIAAKVLPFLDLPLEDLVASDQFKTELLDAANNTLDEHLPVSEARLGKEFVDFISELCSVDISPLVARKEELDKVTVGWELLCKKDANCQAACSRIKPVLDQGKKSEQEMILKIEALENELAAAKVGLDNIRATNEGLSFKLDCYE
ncbi:hypothetical protein PIB30_046434 [Stylosanthes scabra]|uniref:Uncharacterized protein n=1 Tax=Stylosanthes scabra TaxID=79078 RepID=A0ABU6XHS9_9FABA|nr:hypothetical protein [Stylosanthes scabra]